MTWLIDTEPIVTTLATRRSRFAAFLIDQVIGLATLWIARYLAVTVLGVLAYVCMVAVNIAQIILLGRRGQTFGKMILKIAIVDRFDKTPLGYVRAALIRQLPLFAVSLFVPPLALPYLLIDGAPIFASSRRCVHDRLVGTIVIDVPPADTSQTLSLPTA